MYRRCTYKGPTDSDPCATETKSLPDQMRSKAKKGSGRFVGVFKSTADRIHKGESIQPVGDSVTKLESDSLLLVPKSKQYLRWFSFLVVWVCHHIPVALALSGDGEALLALKSFVDPVNSLPWWGGGLGGGSSSSYASAVVVCNWKGVKQCNRDGRVTKLVVEHQNLTGTLDNKSLNRLDQLRVLSFKGNSISGHIPDLSRLANLKSLFLNHNNFSGQFPTSIAGLQRLKVVVMAGNRLSGNIPASMVTLRRLYVLRLEDNKLTGNVPALNQDSLRDFNVSGNRLSGRIPATATLLRFNRSSFSDNLALCGRQIHIPCNGIDRPPATNTNSNAANRSQNNTGRDGKVGKIIGGSVGGAVLLLICAVLGWFVYRRRRGKGKGGIGTAGEGEEGDGEGLGSLVFCGGGGGGGGYGLEELLKASAETLGRGSLGCTYKAVMESGYIVTVKRLKDAEYPSVQEFRLRMEAVGSLRHPNLVPLRAYFHAKEERLLVYDYFPNGSLFSLIHGSRTSGSGKPLHWTSCLKIAEDLATGLLYIHQNTTLPHGNLKSSNVLLGPDFGSCLTDYCLTSLADPDSLQEPRAAATSLFYRAPECSRETRKPPTESADVYSFGVLLLELLTGKTPFQDLVQEHAADIPGWVRSARQQETDSDRNSSCNEASEDSKVSSIVNIAAACVSVVPENRPAMKEVLKVIRDSRAEARVSSNSSGHSPGRWSDTIQSLPSKEHFGK